jgi:PAS domain S-box-containing protein
MPQKAPGSAGQHTVSAISQRRLRVLIENAGEGYFEADANGKLVFFNPAFDRFIDPCHQVRIGQTVAELFTGPDRHDIEKCLHQVMTNGAGDASLDVVLRCDEHGERRLEITMGALNDDHGVDGCYGFVRDITENQVCLEEVQQCVTDLDQADERSEHRFRTFLDFLPDPVCVFNLEDTISYLNPAFTRVFGWTLEELQKRTTDFVPKNEKKPTRTAVSQLDEKSIIHGFESQRLTIDGRLRDVVINGAVYYDERNQPAGKVVTLRDITRENRVARTQQTMSRIAMAMHQHQELRSLLEFVTGEIRELLGVEGASVILLDKKRQEFFLPFTAFEDQEAGRRISEVRLPADKGVVGHVYRTGEPMIINDTSASDLFLKEPDLITGFQSYNIIEVPLRHKETMIGVLMAVNKKEGPFDQEDEDLLMALSSLVALPLENAHVHHKLVQSYDKVNALNQAKDRVIHHLSHELKTPLAVMQASLHVLKGKLTDHPDSSLAANIDRTQRNLKRLLDLQYEISDMLNSGDFRNHALMSNLLDACRDALDALSASHPAAEDIHGLLKERIDAIFGPRETVSEHIALSAFIARRLETIRPDFAHRRLDLQTQWQTDAVIDIPAEVLAKILDGLVRNAVEYTPDGGRIRISTADGPAGPELKVRDYGVGMSAETLKLLRENYFIADDPSGYASKNHYEFGAGGKGFDLLRLTIFSERYDFRVSFASKQCAFLDPETKDCPGNIEVCRPGRDTKDCMDAGGTTVTLRFKALNTDEHSIP